MIHKLISRPMRPRKAVKIHVVVLALVFLISSSFGNLLALAPTVSAASSSFKVATFNLLKTDGGVPWNKDGRGDKIISYLKTVDVVGMQEVSDAARNDLNGTMKTAGYSKTSTDATVDIIWNNSKFSLVEQGDTIVMNHVRCGSQPDVVKHVVWVKLKETASGAEFYFLTTHLVVGVQSCRLTQISKIMALVAKMADAPVIFVGDMNTKAGSKEIDSIQAAGFSNAYDTAATKINIDSASTSGAPNADRRGGKPIDHIFTKAGVTVSSIEIKDQKGSDHLPVEAVVSLAGGGIPLTIGTYNILGYYHGDGTKYAPDRLKQIVTNINTMKSDVIGLQEYRDQVSGNAKELMDELKVLSPSMEMAYMSGKGDADQLNFIYNTSTVRLVSDKAVEVGDSKSGCDGGTTYARIARFSAIASGQEFMVVNVHPTSNHDAARCDTERLSVVTGVVTESEAASYAGPLFVIGDFNANPTGKRGDEKNVNEYMSGAGFGNARDIPGAIRKEGGVIDHVYYKISSIAPPVSYEVLDCKQISVGDPTKYTSSTTCASDHSPLKAVFGGGAESCGNLTAAQRGQFNTWQVMIYDKSCVCSTPSTSSTAGIMSGTNNFQKLATYMASKGLTKYAVAGILGNWYSESKMSAFINESGGSNFPNNGYGLAQWTGGRRTKVLTAIKESLAKAKNTTIKDSFSTFYASKYAGWPPEPDWKKDKQGEINDIPAEVNDAWLKAEVDFMFSEFPAYKIGSAHYLDTLKKYVKVNDSDYILEALNGAKSAGDAATILSVVFEIHEGLDPTKNQRAETAEAMMPDVEAAIGGAGAAANCASNAPVDSTDLSNLTLDGIDPSTLPMPKGSGHSSWKSSTKDVAKILWYLFPNDFTAFSTRSSGGAVSTSCHFSGQAIDMMIGNYKDSTVRTRHEAIAEWLMKNRKELGLTNIIYYDKSFNVWGSNTDKPYSEWSSYSNPGGNGDTAAHRDHIHVSISPCKS